MTCSSSRHQAISETHSITLQGYNKVCAALTQSMCVPERLARVSSRLLLRTPHATQSETVRSVGELGGQPAGGKHDLGVEMNGQKGLRESCQLISNQVMVETDRPPGESSARPWPGAPGLTTSPMVSLTGQIGEPHQSQPKRAGQ